MLHNHLRDMGRNIAELKHHWNICVISLKIWEEILWTTGYYCRDLGRDVPPGDLGRDIGDEKKCWGLRSVRASAFMVSSEYLLTVIWLPWHKYLAQTWSYYWSFLGNLTNLSRMDYFGNLWSLQYLHGFVGFLQFVFAGLQFADAFIVVSCRVAKKVWIMLSGSWRCEK